MITTKQDLQNALDKEWENDITSAHIIFNADDKKTFKLKIKSQKAENVYIIKNTLELSRMAYNEFVYSRVDLFVGKYKMK